MPPEVTPGQKWHVSPRANSISLFSARERRQMEKECASLLPCPGPSATWSANLYRQAKSHALARGWETALSKHRPASERDNYVPTYSAGQPNTPLPWETWESKD